MTPGRGHLTVAREKISVTKVTLVLTTMDWTKFWTDRLDVYEAVV